MGVELSESEKQRRFVELREIVYDLEKQAEEGGTTSKKDWAKLTKKIAELRAGCLVR